MRHRPAQLNQLLVPYSSSHKKHYMIHFCVEKFLVTPECPYFIVSCQFLRGNTCNTSWSTDAMAADISVNTSSGYHLMPDSTKP